MAAYVIVGRASDCTLTLNDPSVSSRHARLSWKNGLVLVEDLASANGTFVLGKKVESALVRPGEDVRVGSVGLPWSRPELKAFLRVGAKGTALALPMSTREKVWYWGSRAVGVVSGAFGVGIFIALAFPSGREALREQAERVQTTIGGLHPASTDQEAYIRARVARKLKDAIDPTNALTRDTAVRIAAQQQGEFRVGQVAAIWQFVREHWRYVNDPNGREYFAKASETIQNGYVGDCDDFAITLAAMVGAIGGEARVIFMESERGGHAYTEACIHDDAGHVAQALAQYYGRAWSRYTTRGRPAHIAFRQSSDCPVWLNLDWNASVPGGDYDAEQWAVAIYPDGRTEALAVGAGQPANSSSSSSTARAAASAPRHLPTPATP